MNIKELHTTEKPVSAISIFKSEMGNATAIQILKGEKLMEHVSKTHALILCIEGTVIFENENGIRVKLASGDYVIIEPFVKHWIEGTIESQLILVK